MSELLNPQELLACLREVLSKFQNVIVAFSGGVDSALLAFVAHQCLGEKMEAALALSPSLPQREGKDAFAFAWEHQIPLRILYTQELGRPDYVANNSDRCYHCKQELFSVLNKVAALRSSDTTVIDGFNVDDEGDFRPGHRAAKELGIRSPYQELRMGKNEIRALAKFLNVSLWDKPAAACLSSRIAYGDPVSVEMLRQVETAEDGLHSLGFRGHRVRVHREVARLEVTSEDFDKAFRERESITKALKQAGFSFVTLDLQGYRTGSLNEIRVLSNTPHGM